VRDADPDRRCPDFGWVTRKLAQSGRHPGASDESAAKKGEGKTPQKRNRPYLTCMLIERMRKHMAADRASFIEPCLPSPADKLRPAPTGFTRSNTTASSSSPGGAIQLAAG
jgi:hypothetical protein